MATRCVSEEVVEAGELRRSLLTRRVNIVAKEKQLQKLIFHCDLDPFAIY